MAPTMASAATVREAIGDRRLKLSQEAVFSDRIRGMVVVATMQAEEEDFKGAEDMCREDRVSVVLIGNLMSGETRSALAKP
jgi:hypothetical protein